ncbi:MAG: glycosyltransferase [Chloroflexia bacterium]|nr:glycosyltransferase [Chloroflexia bacterium]
MRWLWRLLIILLCGERLLKHLAVVRFFRHAQQPAEADPGLVSIMQPILSGDPALAACLEANLIACSDYQREFIWLIDDDDDTARQICTDLMTRYPSVAMTLVALPAPPPGHNPKLVKLIAGSARARGTIICVLDDDTMLPDHGLEQCLPYLAQPRAGLVFGLPYYVSYDNLWSGLVATFVNSSSLMTYIPFSLLHEPVTINGMFYAIRRTTLEAVGGFAGLEQLVADDFAVAERLRKHGYRLVQTPVRHAIRTTVAGPRHYLRLMQRWLIFPRESLMRHLPPHELVLVYSLVALPSFLPWMALAVSVGRPGRATWGLFFAYTGLSYLIFAYHNRIYLNSATPWRWSWMVPLVQMLLPAQFVSALLAPRRINWRGHMMQIERGGTLRLLHRRDQ